MSMVPDGCQPSRSLITGLLADGCSAACGLQPAATQQSDGSDQFSDRLKHASMETRPSPEVLRTAGDLSLQHDNTVNLRSAKHVVASLLCKAWVDHIDADKH